jgi:hypothetical protein
MRITDDLHALATAATRAVDLFERWLQLRAREQGAATPATVASFVEPPKLAGPTYYDTELNLRLNAATERYVTEHGEWPTEAMRRAFIEDGIDFSQL